ncbi:MAG: 4Fe-4S ferredoxin [Bacteroidia bacterium]|nr:4Fe-4S ferredoxin [Bacteroidia bacterium]
MIFYFSGTGNSRWIAEQLAEAQHETLLFIPECMRNESYQFTLQAQEKIGFVFPIYSWGPPAIVLDFIRRLQFLNYQHHYLFFVCSCGDDVGLTEDVFVKLIRSKGWGCDAGFSVAMPNNYVLLPGFDVDPKVLEEKKRHDAMDVLEKINESIERREKLFRCHKGTFPWLKTRLINPLFNRRPIDTRRFLATDACIGCARCVKSCPVQNISLVHGKPVWGENCTSCLACYHVCPQQAVQYGSRTKGKGRYFFPLS